MVSLRTSFLVATVLFSAVIAASAFQSQSFTVTPVSEDVEVNTQEHKFTADPAPKSGRVEHKWDEMVSFLDEFEGDAHGFWDHMLDNYSASFLEEGIVIGGIDSKHVEEHQCGCSLDEEGDLGHTCAADDLEDKEEEDKEARALTVRGATSMLETEATTGAKRYGHYRGGSRDYDGSGWIDEEEVTNSGAYFDFSNVQLYNSRNRRSHEARVDWSCHVNQPNWQDLCEAIVFFEVDHESVLLMNMNGHVHSEEGQPNSWLYLTFFIDDVEHPMPGSADWGQYHVYREISQDEWAPVSYMQQYRVGRGKHEVVVKGRVNFGHMVVNGFAFQVSVIPK